MNINLKDLNLSPADVADIVARLKATGQRGASFVLDGYGSGEKPVRVDMNHEHFDFCVEADGCTEFCTAGINGCTIIAIVVRQPNQMEQRFLGHYDANHISTANQAVGKVLSKIRNFKHLLPGGSNALVEYAIFTPKATDSVFLDYEFFSEISFLEGQLRTIFPGAKKSIVPYESDIGKNPIPAPPTSHFFKIMKINGKTYFFSSNDLRKELFS